MSNKNTTVYHASSIQEVQTILKNIAGISLIGGCTEIARTQTGTTLHLPENILALSRIPELCIVNKTERYIEFGASVTLDTILKLGKKNIPDVFFDAVNGIANPGIRHMATLGGNIAGKKQHLSTFSPLLALDAKLELRTPFEAAWIPFMRFFSNTKQAYSTEPSFISRIRIPTEVWDISVYRRIGPVGIISDITSSFVFLVKLQKNILADIHIAWAGKYFFRKREYENLMIGRGLPFSERDIITLMDKADLFLEKRLFPPSYERKCFLNLLEESLRMLM